MKKFLTMVLAISLTCVLAACGCDHAWTEADCETPRTCSKCGKTEGEALGHDWKEADCLNPRTCSRCGKTEGKALGHKPGEAEAGAVDPLKGSRSLLTRCTVCGEVLEEKEEPLKSLHKDGTFLMNYGEFCQRFDQVFRSIGKDIWYAEPAEDGDRAVCLIKQDDLVCAIMVFMTEDNQILSPAQKDEKIIAGVTCLNIPQVQGNAMIDMIVGLLQTCDPTIDEEEKLNCIKEIHGQLLKSDEFSFTFKRGGLVLEPQVGVQPGAMDLYLTIEK